MSVERIANALLEIRASVLRENRGLRYPCETIARAQAAAIHGALETYCEPDDEAGAIVYLEDCANPEVEP